MWKDKAIAALKQLEKLNVSLFELQRSEIHWTYSGLVHALRPKEGRYQLR